MEADQRRGAPRGRRGAPRVWLPPAKFRNGIWGVGQVVVPYGWLRRTAAIARGSGAQRSVCGNGCEGWVGIAAEITPTVPINPGQSLSHGLRPCQLPLHKGAFPCGGRGIGRGADCRVGPAGLLAMTTVFCHSEERSDVGIRFFLQGNGGVWSPRPTERGGELPQLPGQRLAKRKARR